MIWRRRTATALPKAGPEAVEIPVLTREGLAAIREQASAPGQHGKAWTALTRLVVARLATPPAQASSRLSRELARHHAGGPHYLRMTLGARSELAIEFGISRPTGAPVVIGRLEARWGALGLLGPYAIHVRGQAEALATFNAVLQPYLALPPAAHSAA